MQAKLAWGHFYRKDVPRASEARLGQPRLEIKASPDLQQPRLVVLGGDPAKLRIVCRGTDAVRAAKLDAVEQVERLYAQFEIDILVNCRVLVEREVIIRNAWRAPKVKD
jgi:hypothetical protein